MKWPALPPSCAQTLRANSTPSRIRVTPWMSPLWGESAWREPCPRRWVREGGGGGRLAGARRLPLDERLRLRALAFAMPLDLHDRRDDDRPTLGALLEQVGGGLAHLLLEDHRVDHAVGGHPVERVEHPDAGLLDEVARLRLVDEAAGDDVGAGEHLAALRLDGDHDVDEALAAELAAVAPGGVAPAAPGKPRRGGPPAPGGGTRRGRARTSAAAGWRAAGSARPGRRGRRRAPWRCPCGRRRRRPWPG